MSQIVDLTRLILREVVSQPSCLWEVPLDTSSQISHMFWGMLGFWCKSRWHDALDWDWGGESLFRRVVCVDCPLSSDKKIAKLKIIWILLMAREGAPYTDGARASNLNTPYCDDVACSQVLWVGCFPHVFFILRVKVRAVMAHIRGKFCYTSSFVEGVEVYDSNHNFTMVLTRKRVSFLTVPHSMFKRSLLGEKLLCCGHSKE